MNAGHRDSSYVFEFVDPYQTTIGRSPPLKPQAIGDISGLSHEELLELMADASPDIGDHKFEKEIDVYALVPEQPLDMYSDCCESEEEPDADTLFTLLEEKRKTVQPNVNITPLAVSTQSAKANMSKNLELADMKKIAEVLVEAINKNIRDGKRPDFSIRGVLFKDMHAGEIRKPKPNKNGQFPNNLSVLVRSPMGTGRHINIKCFLKGSITMTGCRIKEDGIAAIKILEQFLRKQKTKVFASKEEAKSFCIRNFSTTMVNSGYSLGFEVDRERLYEFLCANTELNISYAPARYAGVKISFYYNSIRENQDGICRCPGSPCTGDKSTAGKGSGDKIGQCKRVTVAIFESGQVINTGGRNIDQAQTAYKYVNSIISENANKFVKIRLEDVMRELEDI